MGRKMKEIIIEILKRWADNDVNLQSEAAREVLAKELTTNCFRTMQVQLYRYGWVTMTRERLRVGNYNII